jgi:OmcA/MtrC family decaheme c-type cytochrome
MRIELPAVVLACTLAACGAKVDRADVREGGVSTTTPGLSLELRSVEVASGAAPVVTFRATDGTGAPLDLAAEIAAGLIAPRFTLARVGPDGAYANYLTASVAAKPYVDLAGHQQLPTGTATQAVAEPRGAPWPVERLVAKGDGVYDYTFAAPVSGVDPQATHLAGVFATRSAGGKASASATLDFVPAGGPAAPREEVVPAACNGCHGTLQHHNGRRGVKLCLTCHTTQTSDPETGHRLDLTTLVHKIHKGAKLANDWPVVGAGQVVHDWSNVSMAPSHSTYFSLENTGIVAKPVNDPGIVRNCALCHQGADATRWHTHPSAAACGACHDDVDFVTGVNHPVAGVPTPAVDADCARCHVGGDQATPVIDTVHSDRYETTRNHLFSPHTLEITIDAVRNAIAGQAPQVDFTVKVDGAPYNILTQPLGSLGFQLAGPTTDYAEVIPSSTTDLTKTPPSWWSPSALSALCTTKTCPSASVGNGVARADPSLVTAIDAAAGRFTFQFLPTATIPSVVIPAGRTGTYVVSFEGIYKEQWTGPIGEIISKPYAANPVFHGASRNVAYVDVATGQPSTAERRAVVSNDKCNACHVDLGFHGSRARKGVDYCETCHAPGFDNRRRARFRPNDTQLLTLPAGLPVPPTPVFVPESVASKVFIHRIHTGAELPTVKAGGVMRIGANMTAGMTLAAATASDSDFSEFTSPHPVGDCTTCHLDGTWALPELPGLLPVKQAVLDCGATFTDTLNQKWCAGRTPNPVVSEIVTPPLKAVCTSCHDDAATKAHADLNTVQPMTADAVETCAGCHGAGKVLDAQKVHVAP